MNGDDVSAKLDTLIETNRDIRQWLRVMAWEDASAAVEGSLGDDPATYELYDALDGEASIGDIIQDVPIARRTAFARLNEWQQVGIVSKVERGRYDKIASLDALDVTRPDDDGD
jgi:hypothetical protein